MTLLQEIIDGAAGESVSTSTLLRKCMVLGSRLDSQVVEQWVDWELNGYPENASVPDYRNLSMIIRVDLFDVSKTVHGLVVAPEFLDDKSRGFTELAYRSSIAEIEEFLSNSGGPLTFKVGNLIAYLMSQKFTEMHITSAHVEVARERVRHILESVRTRVLKFSLDVGKAFPDSLESESKMPNSEDVRQIFNTTIYGAANLVGVANHSNVQLEMKSNDFSEVARVLGAAGVAEQDLAELERALADEPDLQDEGFGPKVSNWIGRMMQKAAEGGWAVSIGAAGNIVADVVKRYYGIK